MINRFVNFPGVRNFVNAAMFPGPDMLYPFHLKSVANQLFEI